MVLLQSAMGGTHRFHGDLRRQRRGRSFLRSILETNLKWYYYCVNNISSLHDKSLLKRVHHLYPRSGRAFFMWFASHACKLVANCATHACHRVSTSWCDITNPFPCGKRHILLRLFVEATASPHLTSPRKGEGRYTTKRRRKY